jgi:RNA polymerase sigma-70 factor (ECF subfamily)
MDAVTQLAQLSDAELLALTPAEPEAFATALVHCRRYDPARGAAGAWLIGIAANLVANANRRGAVEARTCRRLGIRRPVLAEGEIEVGIGDELLASLSPEQRAAVEARVLHDKDYAQIALEQSVSPQVVRKRVSRGLGSLRARLKEEK